MHRRAAAAHHASRLSRSPSCFSCPVHQDTFDCAGGARPLREKTVPGLLDVFGWCTWDAFYSRVSARGETPACTYSSICRTMQVQQTSM